MAADVRLTAGVVLSRTVASASGESTLEVAVVHRPRYDDWTWPKGGVEDGEHLAVAAAREAHEETGYPVALDRSLGTTTYTTPPAGSTGKRRRQGVPTIVHWWSARTLTTEPGGRDGEVDELRWLSPEKALSLLSYEADRAPLAALLDRPPTQTTVLLMRHASAGDRKSWDGPDDDRPLDEVGREQADALARLLPAFAPLRAVSASPVRCVTTLAPTAARLGLPVEVDPVWDDARWGDDPAATLAALDAAAEAQEARVVVCSQGSTIPGVLARCAEEADLAARHDVAHASRGHEGELAPRSRKGSLWVLSFANGQLSAADYLPAAGPVGD